MKVLLTGFEPFAGVPANPSQLVVEQLSQQQIPGIDLLAAVLPVSYNGAGEAIQQLIHQHKPEAIIMLGVSSDRDVITLERVALNIDDSEVADNEGEIRNGFPIIWQTSPNAYLSTLPIMPMVDMLQRLNIPARISNHAGTFLCNHVFYLVSYEYDTMNQYIPCGFIHLPSISEAFTLDMMVEAIRACITLLLQFDT